MDSVLPVQDFRPPMAAPAAKRRRTEAPATSCGSTNSASINPGPGAAGFEVEPAAPCETLLVLLEHKATTWVAGRGPGCLPPLLLKHQLYVMVGDATAVERDLHRLMRERAVRLVHMNLGADEHAVVLAEDFSTHVRRTCENLGGPAPEQVILCARCLFLRATVKFDQFAHKVDFFLDLVLESSSISLSKEQLHRQAHLSEADITALVKAGALHIRDAVSLWIGIPNMGGFVDLVRKGRQAVLRCIRRAKYKEMLEHVLEQRKLRDTQRLGSRFHIQDAVGLQLVERISTTSGPMLRLTTSGPAGSVGSKKT